MIEPIQYLMRSMLNWPQFKGATIGETPVEVRKAIGLAYATSHIPRFLELQDLGKSNNSTPYQVDYLTAAATFFHDNGDLPEPEWFQKCPEYGQKAGTDGGHLSLLTALMTDVMPAKTLAAFRGHIKQVEDELFGRSAGDILQQCSNILGAGLKIKERGKTVELKGCADFSSYSLAKIGALTSIMSSDETVVYDDGLFNRLYSENPDPRDLPVPWQGFENRKIRPGSLTVLAAWTGVGKSTASMHSATTWAAQGHCGLYVSLEMSCEDILATMAVGHTNLVHKTSISEIAACGGKVKGHNAQLLKSCLYALRQSIRIVRPRAPTVSIIGAMVRDRKAELAVTGRTLDWVIIDYAKLLTATNTRESTVAQLSEIFRDLKMLALELNVAVITPSQLSRDHKKSGNKNEGVLAQLSWSAEVANSADRVISFIPIDPGPSGMGSGFGTEVDIWVCMEKVRRVETSGPMIRHGYKLNRDTKQWTPTTITTEERTLSQAELDEEVNKVLTDGSI